MELKRLNCFLENKTVLVTGSTGFLAKVLVEKILSVQPNVKKIYLLLRAPDSSSARQRMNSEIVEKDLFRVLRSKWDNSGFETLIQKLVPISGDISHDNFGIKDSGLMEEMFEEIDIIVNSAATTNFDDRYDVSLAINTMGPLNLLNFAKKCTQLQIIIHVSTAYVCGDKEGLVHETAFKMGDTLKETSCNLDINFENKLVREKLKQLRSEGDSEKDITIQLKDFGMERAKLFGWPNTYSFTKAMGEMNLREFNDQNIPIVIIRPTIIASTYKHPFPGWIEGVKTMDAVIAGYGKGKLTSFYASPSLILDVIPADMVVNAMIVAMVTHANKPPNNNIMIYQMGSSLRNPVSFSTMQSFGCRYFTESPLADKEGKPIIVGKPNMWNSLFTFKIYMMIRFGLPIKMFQLANIALFGLFQDEYTNRQRKFSLALRLVELYKPYLMFKGVFDDKNSEELQKKTMATFVDANLFNFDPKCIDWEDFMMDSHIPGLVKYAIKP